MVLFISSHLTLQQPTRPSNCDLVPMGHSHCLTYTTALSTCLSSDYQPFQIHTGDHMALVFPCCLILPSKIISSSIHTYTNNRIPSLHKGEMASYCMCVAFSLPNCGNWYKAIIENSVEIALEIKKK